MKLDSISFGDRVAENESKDLSSYFIQTEQWNALYRGKVDIVLGAKGSGKSALYTLLLQKDELFEQQGTLLISIEKPTGKTVFSDITSHPPTSENEFITLWKIYICQLIVNWLRNNDLCKQQADEVASLLIEAGLIRENNSLQKLLSGAKQFAQNLLDFESVEAGASMEGKITGKITFRTPSYDLQKKGYKSVDELLDKLNSYLSRINKKAWLLCDRLDVAFDESLELEQNALRALFKTYRDIEEYDSICLKIFLRDDIWRRITKSGFREASHITRSTTISWSDRDLMSLIVSRALNNKEIVDFYKCNSEEIKSDYDKQVKFYYKLFPQQVDAGEKQSDTFNWIKNRVRDGLSNIAPREIIHFYTEMIKQEQKEQDIGNNKIENSNIVSKDSIKNSTYEISKVKTEQTIFTEYPNLQEYIMALENNKAEHNLDTLMENWKLESEKALEIANNLAEVGFFEERTAKLEKIYKIPFLYRFYLNITQGKAF